LRARFFSLVLVWTLETIFFAPQGLLQQAFGSTYSNPFGPAFFTLKPPLIGSSRTTFKFIYLSSNPQASQKFFISSFYKNFGSPPPYPPFIAAPASQKQSQSDDAY